MATQAQQLYTEDFFEDVWCILRGDAVLIMQLLGDRSLLPRSLRMPRLSHVQSATIGQAAPPTRSYPRAEWAPLIRWPALPRLRQIGASPDYETMLSRDK